jgi:GNAT superfamily N-acetyltransferase
MSEAAVETQGQAAVVAIRPYRPADHRACRQLWAELAEAHREIYDDPTLGGADPGAGFEEFLTRLDLSGVWVAEHPVEGVVGLAGLVLGAADVGGGLSRHGSGPIGEVEPVVVDARLRGRGIGRALLEYIAVQARHRGMRRLSISPASRNVEAIRCLHAAGYDILETLTLTLPLVGGAAGTHEVLDLHGVRFSY